MILKMLKILMVVHKRERSWECFDDGKTRFSEGSEIDDTRT